jgi:hypothetical protein
VNLASIDSPFARMVACRLLYTPRTRFKPPSPAACRARLVFYG